MTETEARDAVRRFLIGGNAATLAEQFGLEALANIREQLRGLRRQQAEAVARYRDETRELDRQIRAIQMACPHPQTTYHPDPAGGSDSSTTCDLCGGEV